MTVITDLPPGNDSMTALARIRAAQHQSLPPPARAFTVIVSGPNHLIGDTAQIERYRAGTIAELPPWYGEWADMLPHWHLEILESPTAVANFFRGAMRDPHTPRVGFISNSKLSLSSGFGPGMEDRTGDGAYRRDRSLPDATSEQEKETLTKLRAQRRRQRRTQEEQAASAPDSAMAVQALLPGTSPRTQRRDALVRQATVTPIVGADPRTALAVRVTCQPIPRLGLCCSTCGRRVLNGAFAPQSLGKLKAKGFAAITCEWCGDKLGQITRERDNVRDRGNPVWESPFWSAYHYDIDGQRSIPWGVRPQSNPRYALGLLIGKRYKGMVDVYISDEVHECKGDATAIGRAFGAMVTAAHRTVGLTGTLFGGKASDVFSLLLRMGNLPVLEQYGWDGKASFVQEVGVVDEITRETVHQNASGHFSGKPTVSTEVEERPGITAGLAMILQNQGIGVLLKHMGFRLVNYTEELVTLELPDDIAGDYRALEAAGKAIIPFEGHDALGSYLQSTLLYPYAPWAPKTVASRRKQEHYTPPAYSPDLLLPHHEWLAEYCAEQIRTGRRVLIYCEHTGTDDITPDIAAKITHLAGERYGATLKIAVLRSTTVQAGERRAWFAAREADGTNVVLCNPRLVKTGLNLIGWPSIVVLEPVYSLFVLAQAKRRAFRPTQRQDCTVTYLCYDGTMSAQAIGIVARKSAAAAILNGDDLSGGLMEFDAGMSLLQELAKLVISGEERGLNSDVQALLASGAAALKADLESGTTGMIGAPPVVCPSVTNAAAQDTLVLEAADVVAPALITAPTPGAGDSSRPKVAFGDLAALRSAPRIRAKRQTLVACTGVTLESDAQLDLFSALARLEQAEQHVESTLFR